MLEQQFTGAKSNINAQQENVAETERPRRKEHDL